jgi:hypothetical protein
VRTLKFKISKRVDKTCNLIFIKGIVPSSDICNRLIDNEQEGMVKVTAD